MRAGPKAFKDAQHAFPFGLPSAATAIIPAMRGPRAIEDDGFPFEALSEVAELESWRKEINRPLT